VGLFKVAQVTRLTGGGQGREGTVGIVGMTAFAGNRGMGSFEREGTHLVYPIALHILEGHRIVTAGAGRPKLPLMHIRMTIITGCRLDGGKIE
jgi:hypothetical protein